MIEQLKKTKVMLDQESLSSIAADGIVLLPLWSASCCLARPRGGRHVRARLRIRKYEINLKNSKITIEHTEDNKFIPTLRNHAILMVLLNFGSL
jgi:hypothetical protein